MKNKSHNKTNRDTNDNPKDLTIHLKISIEIYILIQTWNICKYVQKFNNQFKLEFIMGLRKKVQKAKSKFNYEL